MIKTFAILFFGLNSFFLCLGQADSKPRWPNKGNAMYSNPLLHADFSDPDAIRVGDDYYLVASSFNCVPGIPILHSKDLVHWQLIGYALHRLLPEEYFSTVRPGAAVWAPSIRYHNKEFYIYYPDPDFGIYLIKSKNINGPWSSPILVQAGKGLIDPCPLWDDDGKVYLVHAFAGSRAGIKSILVAEQLNAEGTKVINDEVMIYDGHQIDPTVEGPKIYKQNGYYYVLAPAGGVSTGWQLALRSKNIYGPYQRKIILAQGNTNINGPHQGAWVHTTSGEDWFLHFQDKAAYGRVLHLQPMHWKNNWPVIGINEDSSGIGEPAMQYRMPKIYGNPKPLSLVSSDEFNTPSLGLQWQWQANPGEGWAFPNAMGSLRLNCVYQKDISVNKWLLPNLLLQKFPEENFVATTKISFNPANINDRIGFIVFGKDYAYLSLVKKDDGLYISFNKCLHANESANEDEILLKKITANNIYFKITVANNAVCTFSYSEDGSIFQNISESFTAMPGMWVGAKIGYFCNGYTKTNDSGFADLDWIRFSKK